MLASVTITKLSATHMFTYSTAGSGEMTKLVTPYGAEIEWGYGDAPSGSGKTLREVTGRWLKIVRVL
jgi:hypothetical protein